jgi:aryl sulfotransferase
MEPTIADREHAPEPAGHAWPRKTRELQNHHMDSTVWNDFAFRPDDVVVATYGKAGTTWTQHIVGQLIFGGRAEVDVAALSPWVELRVPPKAEKLATIAAQRHRRFLKTHLPVDALVFSPAARYIYVGRDGRDIAWSLHNHQRNATDAWYRTMNDTPGRVGPPIQRPPDSPRCYFIDWLRGDGYPIWSFWDNAASWWAVRHLPNVLLLHYADLKADLPAAVRRIAAFLEIDLDPQTLEAVLRHTSFAHMKAHAGLYAPRGGRIFRGGPRTFFHSGTNGRWRGALTTEESRLYEQTAERRLGPACARWLAEGAAGDRFQLKPETRPGTSRRNSESSS